MPFRPTNAATIAQTTPMAMCSGESLAIAGQPCQQFRREIGVDRQPAELQDAHEEARHQEPTLHAVGRRADHGQRQAGLHAHHARRQIAGEVADQRRHDHAQQRRRPARARGSRPVPVRRWQARFAKTRTTT